VGQQSVAVWASRVWPCGPAECGRVGQQSVAVWASRVRPCGPAECGRVGQQSVAREGLYVCSLCVAGRSALPFQQCSHINNVWSDNKKVTSSKDGQVRSAADCCFVSLV